MRVAFLLSLSDFEGFYSGVLRLSRKKYLTSYRNDFSWEYSSALLSKGLAPWIYLPTLGNNTLTTTREGVNVRFIALPRWYRVLRRVLSVCRSPVGRYVRELINTLALLPKLLNALSEDEIDVLYVQEYWTARFDLLARRSPVPVLGADHGGSRRRQLTWFKRESFRSAAVITCQTTAECIEVKKYGGRPELLSNWVDTDFFCPGEGTTRGKWILTVARLTDGQKRTSDLVRALATLPREWTLSVAGTGPDEQKLRLLATRLGVRDRVKFLGFVNDRQELRKLYRRCGVFALPSANEGLPLAALEAMSSGAPAVLSDIAPFRNLVTHGTSGFLVPVGSPRALARAIESAWTLQHLLGQAARERIEMEYSRGQVTDRLVKLLEAAARQQQ